MWEQRRLEKRDLHYRFSEDELHCSICGRELVFLTKYNWVPETTQSGDPNGEIIDRKYKVYCDDKECSNYGTKWYGSIVIPNIHFSGLIQKEKVKLLKLQARVEKIKENIKKLKVLQKKSRKKNG